MEGGRNVSRASFYLISNSAREVSLKYYYIYRLNRIYYRK